MPGQPPLLAFGVAIFGLHLGVCLFARPLACVPASVPVRARLVPFVFRGFLGQLMATPPERRELVPGGPKATVQRLSEERSQT